MKLKMRRIKNKVRQCFPNQSVLKGLKVKLNQPGAKVVLMDTPTNGNLGDQALAYAAKYYMHKILPEIEVVDVPNDEINSSLRELKRNSKSFDFVLWNGGGNIGNLYPTAEYSRWDAFKVLRFKKFIILPQSVYYSDEGSFFKKSVQQYLKKKDLFVYLREKKSYKYMDKNFEGLPVSLVPDIVFSLEDVMQSLISTTNKRQGVLTLLRSDKEKKPIDTGKYIKILESDGKSVTSGDTFIPNMYIDSGNRDKLLVAFWNEISNYELVVTDRLHGMIFAYLTKTPAIVFQNNNWKIKSSYDTWLKKADFIEVVESDLSSEEFQMTVEKVLTAQTRYLNISQKFTSLELRLKEIAKDGKK